MTVGIRVKFDGMEAEQFDKLEAELGTRENIPAGLIFHASGPLDDGGWGVLAFWESREKFDSFVSERVGPAAAAVGMTVQPEIREFQVHEYLRGN